MRWDFDTAEPTWLWVEGRLQIAEESVCVRALESCGKYRLPGPPVVLILRSGQENLYSEADGLLTCVEIPEIFLSLKDKGLLFTRPGQNSPQLVLGQNLSSGKPDGTQGRQGMGVLGCRGASGDTCLLSTCQEPGAGLGTYHT